MPYQYTDADLDRIIAEERERRPHDPVWASLERLVALNREFAAQLNELQHTLDTLAKPPRLDVP